MKIKFFNQFFFSFNFEGTTTWENFIRLNFRKSLPKEIPQKDESSTDNDKLYVHCWLFLADKSFENHFILINGTQMKIHLKMRWNNVLIVKNWFLTVFDGPIVLFIALFGVKYKSSWQRANQNETSYSSVQIYEEMEILW